MSQPTKSLTREQLLETCFCEMPSQVGEHPLRPLSPGSFTLLGRLGNLMMVGGDAAPGQSEMLAAVVEYIWVHSAPILTVAAITDRADLPEFDVALLGLQITFGQALAFLDRYKDCALRMQASLAEVEDTEAAPGKLDPGEPSLAGSPLSFSPLAVPETPLESVTSSGLCPSSGPFPTSSLPMFPTEPPAAGPAPSTPPPPFLMPAPSSLPCSSAGAPN